MKHHIEITIEIECYQRDGILVTRQRTWRENRKLWVTFADDDDDLYWCVLDDGQIDRILDDYEKELNLREPNQDVEYQVSLHAFREIAGNQRWFAVGL